MYLPTEFEEKMKKLLGEEFEAYIRCFEDKHCGGLRVNRLKISPEDFEKICPFEIKKVPWIPNGFFYNVDDQLAKHPYYYAGLYYIQEPSAMTPASLLPITPGDKVLDVCAAPGGKSTELAARLQGKGLLVSNDISNSRAKALLKNLEVIGARNAVVLSEAPSKLVGRFEGFFDKILIDAPCSGEGMFRKSPAIMKNWEQYGVDYYNDLQKEIILDAAKMLKPGGLMLYSTCTFSPEENEGTMKFLLEHYPEFRILDAIAIGKETYGDKVDYEGFDKGRPEWIEGGFPELQNCIRLWPHHIQGEGHFVVLLQKGEEPVANSYVYKKDRTLEELISISKVKLTEEAIAFLKELKIPIGQGLLRLRDEKLYLVPEELDDVTGLRTLRHGLLLGEMKKNRFEPSQALASTLTVNEYEKTIHLSVDDPNVIKYLKCETIELSKDQCQGKDGWVLVCVDNYPLGWAKLNKGNLKNKFLSGWRWM